MAMAVAVAVNPLNKRCIPHSPSSLFLAPIVQAYAASIMAHKSTLPEQAEADRFAPRSRLAKIKRGNGHCHDRPLCLDQPECAENLHHARRDEAALPGAFRRRVEKRAIQSGIHQDQSEFENS